MKFIFSTAALLAAMTAISASAQQASSLQQRQVPPGATAEATSRSGVHGGSIKEAEGLRIETVLSEAGIKLYLTDASGEPLPVVRGRGAATLRVEGNAKRYRYDLLPDGRGGLTAPVNLSKIAGYQVEVDVQLVGLPKTNGKMIRFTEVATVPANEAKLAAAAIARQKLCPVSGKPLGSMGKPVAVDVGGKNVYVCCAGCVDAVKSNPLKFAGGRPEITVTSATKADAALIAQQGKCPVMDEPLGSMGQPIKVTVGDKPIFLCCKGCIKRIKAEPAKYLAMVYGGSAEQAVPAGTEQVRTGVFKVTSADAPFVAAQKKCPVMDEPLDAMGGPYKVNAAGKAIYICCPGCAKRIAADPQKYIGMLAEQGVQAPMIR